MLLNKISVVILASSVATSSYASDVYVEGSLGFYDMDINSEAYSGTSSGITLTNFSGTSNYDIDPSMGLEVGLRVNDNIRLGVYYTKLDLDFKSVDLKGSLSDGTTTYTGPVNVSEAQLNALGIIADDEAKLTMLSAYYDFDMDSEFTPYIGFGFGQADIKNYTSKETAMAVLGGINYSINENLYLMSKFSYTTVDGGTDGLGIKYKDSKATSAHFGLGINF